MSLGDVAAEVDEAEALVLVDTLLGLGLRGAGEPDLKCTF